MFSYESSDTMHEYVQADVSLFCFVVLLFVRVMVLLRLLRCAVCSL